VKILALLLFLLWYHLSFSGELNAQQLPVKSSLSFGFLLNESQNDSFKLLSNIPAFKPASLQLGSSAKSNTWSKQLPVFCRMEWNLEKAAKFPVRIRLGEYRYTENLEGKSSWK
jgi:hypothetical protein